MPKSSVKVRICESCNEQDAVKNLDGLGWACSDCAQSFEDLQDDETHVGELDDEEIDSLVALDELESEDDGEAYDRRELVREGFVVADKDDDEYNY